MVGVKSPICSHCYATNPFFTEEDRAEYDEVARWRNGDKSAAEVIEWAKARRAELGWD